MLKSLQFLRFNTTKVMNAAEENIKKMLEAAFPNSAVTVEDMSAGCGAHYKLILESAEFKGKSKLAQHKMVSSAIKDEISKWHAVTIETHAK
uniref:BolA-like protein n=1 Tax=Rhabditophanes sp. KR3021 TaxID=114890 RepID=A0AC35UAN9_9BILA